MKHATRAKPSTEGPSPGKDTPWSMVRARRLREVHRLTRGVARKASYPLLGVRSILACVAGESKRGSGSLKGGSTGGSADGSSEGVIAELGAATFRCQTVFDGLSGVIDEIDSYARTAFVPGEPTSRLDEAVRRADLLTRSERGGQVSIRANFAEMPPVRIRQGDLVQILLNLFLNSTEAAKAVGRRKVNIALDAELRRSVNEVHLEIRDDVPGLPADSARELSDHRGLSSGQAQAEGCGLGICVYLAECAGGSLRLSSNGEGTAATLELPIN